MVAPVDVIWVRGDRALSCGGYGWHAESEGESAGIVHRGRRIDDFATGRIDDSDLDAGVLPWMGPPWESRVMSVLSWFGSVARTESKRWRSRSCLEYSGQVTSSDGTALRVFPIAVSFD